MRASVRVTGQTFQHAVVRLLVMWPESLDELCRFGPLIHHLQLHIAAAAAAAQAQLWGTPGMCTHSVLTMYPCTLAFESLLSQINFCIALNFHKYYQIMNLHDL